MKKVIITAALTGTLTPKEANPNIPMTPQEIARDAYACWQAGAAIVHLHMRDDKGKGTMDKEKFRETVEQIKSKCDVIINLTSSGEVGATDEERMAHLRELKPEMASFDAGTFNWMPSGVFMNSPQFLEKLGSVMLEHGIKPELEIFDSGMIHNTEYYMQKGLIAKPPHYQFVLGVLGGARATIDNLVYLKNLLPPESTWSAFGIGKDHLPILYAAIALGGHVRVGLEDNIYYVKNKLATNPDLVARAARLIKEADKAVATPNEARQLLRLRAAAGPA